MISNDKITEIFCTVDDFCKEITQILEGYSIASDNSAKKRRRKSKLSDSEVISIMVFFSSQGVALPKTLLHSLRAEAHAIGVSENSIIQ